MVASKDAEWLHQRMQAAGAEWLHYSMQNGCIKGCTKQVHSGCIKEMQQVQSGCIKGCRVVASKVAPNWCTVVALKDAKWLL